MLFGRRLLALKTALCPALMAAALAVVPLVSPVASAADRAPVALVHSENTAAATVNYPTYEDEYKTAAKWLDAFFSYDVLSDQDVENGKLAGYKLAILPENAVMSDAQLQALRDFTAAGGKLLVVYSTSLRNAGLQLVGLQLGDLMGVQWIQWSGEKNFKQLRFVDSSPVLAGAPESVPMPSGATQLVGVLDNGKTLGVRADADGNAAASNPAAVVESDAGLYISFPIFAEALLTEPAMQQFLYAVVKGYAPTAVKAEFAPVAFAGAK